MNAHNPVPSNRVADYFVILGAGDLLIPVPDYDQPKTSQGNPLKMMFTPMITDRYPVQDQTNIPFPEGVPLFNFPNGIELCEERPNPLFYSFVHTSELGHHMVGCCLVFYEPLTDPQQQSLKLLFKDHQELCSNPFTDLFIPRSLCIISQWPFIVPFKKILCQLYRLSLTPSSIPIERYICNFIDDVPAPPVGLVEISYYLGDLAINFRRPPANHPNAWTGVPMNPLFECLDPENILILLSAVLVERQIIFISTQYSLLTSCAEVITSLIYPLNWSHVYIPILPRCLLGVLNAPLPIMVGIHASSLECEGCCVADEAVLVFVDENRISLGSLGPPPSLPERRKKKLLQIIHSAAPVFQKRPPDWTTSRLPFFDSAFEMAVRPEDADGDPNQGHLAVNEIALREGFLKFFVAILMNYKKFVIQGGDDDPYRILRFKGDEFIAEHPSDWTPLLSQLIKSQAFSQFIDERMPSIFQLFGRSSRSASFSISAAGGEVSLVMPLMYNPMCSRNHDILFFDESINAKINRYTFRRKVANTDFLFDESCGYSRTFVPPRPDTTGLPEISEPYIYPTFPKLNPLLFSSPREQSVGALEQLKQGISAAKEHTDPVAFDGHLELIGIDLASFLVYLSIYVELLSHLSAGKSQAKILSSLGKAGDRESGDLPVGVGMALGLQVSQQPSTRQIIHEYQSMSGSLRLRRDKSMEDISSLPRTMSIDKFRDRSGSTHSGMTVQSVLTPQSQSRQRDSMEVLMSKSLSSSEQSISSTSLFGAAATPSPNLQMKFFNGDHSEVIHKDDRCADPSIPKESDHTPLLNSTSNQCEQTDNLPVRKAGPSLGKAKASVSESFPRFSTGFEARVSRIIRSEAGRRCLQRLGEGYMDPGNLSLAQDLRSQETFMAARLGLETAFELFHLMLERDSSGLASEDPLFRELAAACADTCNYKRALDLLFCMWDEGFEPNTTVYDEIARACQMFVFQDDSVTWDKTPNRGRTPSNAELGFLLDTAKKQNNLNLPTTSAQVKELYDCLCDGNPGKRAGVAAAKTSKDVSRRRTLDVSPPHAPPKNPSHQSRLSLNNIFVRASSFWHRSVDRESLSGSSFDTLPPKTQSRFSQTSLRVSTDILLEDTVGSAASSPGLGSSSKRKTPKPKKSSSDIAWDAASCDTPYGFSRQNSTGKDSSSLSVTTVSNGCQEDLMDPSCAWCWIPLNVVIAAGRSAIHAASETLVTLMLLSERALDKAYPGLHIDLFSPFGTACKNLTCRHALTLAELRTGWLPSSTRYTTQCPVCKREFVPSFCVHCEATDWEGSEGRGSALWCELLSPWVLRKEIQTLILQGRIDTLLSTKFLHGQGAVLFWNLIVTFRLMGLPYAFLLSNNPKAEIPISEILSTPLDPSKS